MADEADSKSVDGDIVWVQVPLPALHPWQKKTPNDSHSEFFSAIKAASVYKHTTLYQDTVKSSVLQASEYIVEYIFMQLPDFSACLSFPDIVYYS